MREIILTQGKVALVDDEDYERINQHKWYAAKNHNTHYATRAPYNKTTKKQSRIKMETVVLGIFPKGLIPDHKDGNGLNNQKSNLRLVTIRQNGQNRHEQKTSRYPGVHWKKRNKKWVAQVQIEKKMKHLGLFILEEDAFAAYKNAVKTLTGQEVLCG